MTCGGTNTTLCKTEDNTDCRHDNAQLLEMHVEVPMARLKNMCAEPGSNRMLQLMVVQHTTACSKHSSLPLLISHQTAVGHQPVSGSVDNWKAGIWLRSQHSLALGASAPQHTADIHQTNNIIKTRAGCRQMPGTGLSDPKRESHPSLCVLAVLPLSSSAPAHLSLAFCTGTQIPQHKYDKTHACKQGAHTDCHQCCKPVVE